MSKLLKFILVSVGIVAVLVLAVWISWRWFSGQALPKTRGRVRLEGLQAPVEILRDEYGVAHIYGSTPEDLFFAMGYTHAQERFWQMEFQRRVAAGRLSEIFGEATLETDRYLRQFNFKGSTEEAYDMLDAESRLGMDSYAKGVNAYIQDRKPAQLGLEFALLGLQGVDFTIEEWTPVDSMIWGYMMIFDQSDQMETELTNIGRLAAVGLGLYQDLQPAYRPDRPTIIQAEDLPPDTQNSTIGYQPPFDPEELLTDLDASAYRYLESFSDGFTANGPLPQSLADLGFGMAGASNSFAVAGARAETGQPFLANDPHMAVNVPSLWYEIGVHCIEKSPDCMVDFRGFSLPGIPLVLIGHNDRIAWGLTNAAFDAEDVFIEKVNPQNPNQYEVNGKWVDMELRREEIQVRDRDEPVVITVRSTRNGVVGSDSLTEQRPFSYGEGGLQPYVLSYAWPALGPVRSLQAVMMVNRAQDWDEFVDALQYFDAGKQNWLYADVDGNIGYVLPGKIPIRAKGDGTLPVPGWNDEYRWTGFIPYNEMPRVLNPKQGFIVAANNPQLRAEDYPYLLGKRQDLGQRAARLSGLIQDHSTKITLADMQAFQTDNQSVAGLEYIPYLKGLVFEDAAIAAARDRLLQWDGQMVMESPEAVLYASFWKHLVHEIFNDQFPEELAMDDGTGTEDIVYHLMGQPDNDWWDRMATPDIKERRDAVLKIAFERAYQEDTREYGSNLDDWHWSDVHQITFVSPTMGKSGIGVIENLFNRGPFPVNGSTTVVQKTCWSLQDPFTVYCIPALRQVIDLNNLSDSQMVHSPGQSGHPRSSHYDDFIELWRTFQYHPSNWLRSDVEAGKYETLTLQPR
jgi:penicillin amidase